MKYKAIVFCLFVSLWFPVSVVRAVGEHVVTVSASGDTVVCVGDNASLSATASCSQEPVPVCCLITSYVWSAPGGDPSSGTTPGGNSSSFSCSYDEAGTKTVTVTAKCCVGISESTDVTVTVVEVESLLLNDGEFDDGDDNPDTKSFVVCKADSGVVTVTATPNPGVAEADLPSCWSLSGGTPVGLGKLRQTVDKTASGVTTITCTAGSSSKITRIYVLEMTDLTPDQGTKVDDGDGDPNTKVYWIDYDSSGGSVTIDAEFTEDSPIPDANDYVSACSDWSLTGGSGGTATYRTIEKDVPGKYVISGSCYSSYTVGLKSQNATVSIKTTGVIGLISKVLSGHFAANYLFRADSRVLQ